MPLCPQGPELAAEQCSVMAVILVHLSHQQQTVTVHSQALSQKSEFAAALWEKLPIETGKDMLLFSRFVSNDPIKSLNCYQHQ